MTTEFKLPELGENIEKGQVVNVLVKEGDTIDVDQPVLEVETDKALIEVPSTVKGRIAQVHIKSGEEASVGQTILTLEGGDGTGEAKPKDKGQEKKDEEEPVNEAKAKPEQQEEDKKTRVQTEGKEQERILKKDEDKAAKPKDDKRSPAPAAPSVRRLAREAGVDIHDVPGSGPEGRISAEDVRKYVGKQSGALAREGVSTPGTTLVPTRLPDLSKWGEIERIAMSGLRRTTSQNLTRAWVTVPHVTQCDKADVTNIEAFRKRYGKKVEASGGKLTITAILIKVLASALKVFPKFSASVDTTANEIVYKKYCHIGVAVDTENGLLVPVVRDADKKNITEISIELTELAERARTRKLNLEEMQGGSISVTNLGGFGGTYFTPIVNWPEVAILGVGRGRMEPAWNDKEGTFEPRLLLPLMLSYDHRLIDGADGIRFLRWVVDALENPLLLPLEG